MTQFRIETKKNLPSKIICSSLQWPTDYRMSLCRRPIHRIALAAKTGSFIAKTTLRSFSQQNISTQFEQKHFVSQSKRSFIFYVFNLSSPCSNTKQWKYVCILPFHTHNCRSFPSHCRQSIRSFLFLDKLGKRWWASCFYRQPCHQQFGENKCFLAVIQWEIRRNK